VSELPYRATRVLRAVPVEVLPVGLKLLWLEMYGLDNGDLGCTASAAYLAARLGFAARTVEEYRARLETLGLAWKVPSTRGWHLTMPSDCIPAGERPEDEAVQACARILAAFLAPTVPTVDAAVDARSAPGKTYGADRTESTVLTVPNPGADRGSRPPESTAPTGDSVRDPLGPQAAPPLGGGWKKLDVKLEKNLQPEVGGLANGTGRREAKAASQGAAPLDEREASAMAKWEAARRRAAEREGES
jgi:hypothetical protein